MKIPCRSSAAPLFRVAAIIIFVIGLFFPACLLSNEWREVTTPRQWSFPRDHGSHPEYRTEWWYFTGNLNDNGGRRYGYQLTFFRYGLALQPKQPSNVWSVRDIYFTHFALTDVSRNAFHYTDRVSRVGPGLAGAKGIEMEVRVLGWSAAMEGNRMDLRAAHGGMELALRLTPAKPVVLHGNRGLSKKGPAPGQAAYYYSFTDLRTEGSLRTPDMRAPVTVRGTSWFDQEFGSNQMAQEYAGWDWFALHLNDGRDLMVYYIRRKDGTVERESSGTLVERDGASRHLGFAEIEMTVLSYWKSSKSAGRYPAAWRIRVPGAAIDVTVNPLVAGQELITTASTAITYWEGAVTGKGTSQGKEVAVEGYAELTGYAGTLGGIF
ncbi:MAG: lipocalin-like domain-containing protein [Syntrophales bacterium]|nr:lipocalin-like domain-containing protein [Syntrophales bacterium]